ncbi:hypothetical protein HPB50_026517 [Hyalomma asiaticum]|uniref:Uncharacterized protein n=2 Tax=Hyalomma asiaticum TaxID=266040 RepID=A0ACB7S5T9_HYAAI|nr:hypothetical protein HPB50_026516 [Hyalomma asiaticum]KAH6929316.1 hypothetical protein HPB50_026517 [Hyalomma asiaticum]
MDQPMYEVIVGNIPGARDAHDPDPEWGYGTKHSKNKAAVSKRYDCRCYGKTTKKQDPKEEDPHPPHKASHALN